MGADILVTQGAKTSATMILTMWNRIDSINGDDIGLWFKFRTILSDLEMSMMHIIKHTVKLF